ncbi:unnamed protein product [Cuscuta campestris]|uniref:MULE transposase domain-containing protein n=1 Tax=Cuscuta campestris TaxID=132261 RepID=A0A484N563_9ASTE|nr:unnamed protein product [Cuscuta campestris]
MKAAVLMSNVIGSRNALIITFQSREGKKHVPTISLNDASHDNGHAALPKPGRRRRISKRIGCMARVAFRILGHDGYVLSIFEEQHNHPLTSLPYRPFSKINRNIDLGHKKFILNCAKANIGTMKSYRLFKESAGGYSSVGAIVVDFKNIRRDLKAYIAGGDAQMVIDKLFRKSEVCPGFRFDYEVDEYDQLSRLFWCDAAFRKSYSLFGDVVSFDATYKTNRYMMIFASFTGVDNHKKCMTFGFGLLSSEDAESYSWLLRSFMNAMGNAPSCIITDQDPSM